jgi:aminobenzoyl-glutamate transport protein
MSGFFVVAVAIAQFLACFKWTNAGVYLAVQGAEGARSAGLTGLPLLLAFSLITAVLSLFVASSSSLWALLAPVFVPLGMLLGYHPAAPQLAFRIAESSTNIITPMTSYLIVLLPHLQRHRPGAGLGTLISLMLPYAALFFTGWLLLSGTCRARPSARHG